MRSSGMAGRGVRLVLGVVVGLFLAGMARGQAPTGEPTFRVTDAALGKDVRVIAYGDMRFHDPSDTKPANPAARRALVARVAEERPAAVQLSGDVPYRGAEVADYDVYRAETASWRAAGLRVYPAIGNHELSGTGEKEQVRARGMQNWWATFPELNGRRWYSVALGSRVALVQLDSNSDLTDGSVQRQWLDAQLKALPKTVDFVLIGLHHPPVADIQTHIEVDHNPRPNEIALRDSLTAAQPKMHAQMVVIAGHIHNYERAEMGGVVYLVSGGGGARPYEVERTAQDLYQDKDFPNFHYVVFAMEGKRLKATMIRLKDPEAAVPEWQTKDQFEVKARR